MGWLRCYAGQFVWLLRRKEYFRQQVHSLFLVWQQLCLPPAASKHCGPSSQSMPLPSSSSSSFSSSSHTHACHCSAGEDLTADVERLRSSWVDLIEQTEGWLDFKP